MNIIPSTFEQKNKDKAKALPPSLALPYAVLGQALQEEGLASLVILGRRNFLDRQSLILQARQRGFKDLLFLDSALKAPEAEQLCKNNPGLRVLLCDKSLNAGARVNLAIKEALEDWIFVLWADQSILPFIPDNFNKLKERDKLCIVPLCREPKGEVLPSLYKPEIKGKTFQVLSLLPSKQEAQTLFPFDFTGLYNRRHFERLGHYDESFESAWWQKVEFGCRAHLWGYDLECVNTLRLQYREDPEIEDTTANEDYLKFCLKILLPRFNMDHVQLDRKAWFSWYVAAGGSFFKRRREFKEGQKWLAAQGHQYRHDFQYLLELWNTDIEL